MCWSEVERVSQEEELGGTRAKAGGLKIVRRLVWLTLRGWKGNATQGGVRVGAQSSRASKPTIKM